MGNDRRFLPPCEQVIPRLYARIYPILACFPHSYPQAGKRLYSWLWIGVERLCKDP